MYIVTGKTEFPVAEAIRKKENAINAALHGYTVIVAFVSLR